MAIKKVTAPKFLSGLWGEALVVRGLDDLGFEVRWDGGLTAGRDLIASRNGSSWLAQVKTTQKPTGLIAWAKDGSYAMALQHAAVEKGLAGAFFVLVQIHSAGEHTFDLQKGHLLVSMPSDFDLVALSSQQFADDVDRARFKYSETPRKRAGRLGEPIGSFHRADGLLYPMHTSMYPYISEFVESLP